SPGARSVLALPQARTRALNSLLLAERNAYRASARTPVPQQRCSVTRTTAGSHVLPTLLLCHHLRDDGPSGAPRCPVRGTHQGVPAIILPQVGMVSSHIVTSSLLPINRCRWSERKGWWRLWCAARITCLSTRVLSHLPYSNSSTTVVTVPSLTRVISATG